MDPAFFVGIALIRLRVPELLSLIEIIGDGDIEAACIEFLRVVRVDILEPRIIRIIQGIKDIVHA